MALLGAPAAGLSALPALAQVTGGPILADPLTGVALGGFDPVSYFTEGEGRAGRSDFEYVWRGVPHYFANAANRDVFIANPEIYAPRFGGHCVMSLARGYLSDGKPQLHLIVGQRLYFFHSIGNRSAFMAAQDAAIAAAERNWSEPELGDGPA